MDLAAALRRVILYEGRIATAGEPIEHHSHGYHASKQLYQSVRPRYRDRLPARRLIRLVQAERPDQADHRPCNSRSLPGSAPAPNAIHTSKIVRDYTHIVAYINYISRALRVREKQGGLGYVLQFAH